MQNQVPPNFPPQRVIAYIDGFNLYYGLKSQGWRRYYWLDVATLCGALLQNGQQLTRTKYFTARIASPPDTHIRQRDYLEALQTRPDLEIFFGQYLVKTRTCRTCGVVDNISEEKMTDVNIAVQILSDAFRDQYDTALIISGDSDLVPPIREVRRLFPEKRILVGFPPGRSSYNLKTAASAYFSIGRGRIAGSQLPQTVTKNDGTTLACPARWR